MGTRVSIRPSPLGNKGLLLFATLELAFLATNYSNLFFLLLAFSAVLGVSGAGWAHRNLRGLCLADLELGAAASGGPRTFKMVLSSDRCVRFDLAIELPLHAGHDEVGYVACLSGTQTLTGSVPAQPRGVRKLTHVRITSHFPFGFFVARTRLPLQHELVSYPTPAPLGNAGVGAGHAGDRGGLAAGRGATVTGLRAFGAGDAMADVHWKATARRGTAIVKEREREREPAVEIVLDRRCQGEVFEHALSQVTTMILAARHGSALRLRSQGTTLQVSPDQGGAAEALHWLAAAETLPDDGPAPPAQRTAMLRPEPDRAAP